MRFDTGQIEGSYCPGDYDLSMGGRKFCGIAQRRQLKALAVQAFVNAEGRSQDRTEVVNEFYKRAGGGKTMAGVLDIQSGVMGSITELHPAFPGTAVWLEQIKLAAEAEHAASLLIDPEQTDPLIKQMKSRYDPRFSPSRRS